MQMHLETSFIRYLKRILVIISLVTVIYILRIPIKQVAVLVGSAAILAFLCVPLAKTYEKKLNRPIASLLSIASIGVALVLLLWFFLPLLIQETIRLSQALPVSFGKVSEILGRIGLWIESQFPGISLPKPDLSGSGETLSNIASGTIALAGNIADILTNASLAVVLSYFFLRDRNNILLRLELLIPQRMRPMAVRLCGAVLRELRLYLRGQALVSLAVAIIAAIALMIIGVRSAIVLGPIIGILNMIPYFGPFIGGIPAVLVALGDSWQKAILTIGVLAAVQQLDSMFISPRIIGNITGLSPAVVLVGIFAGAQIGGIAGMLLALPSIMTIRTLFRVFVQKYENI